MKKEVIFRLGKNIKNFVKRKPGFILVNLLLNYQCTQRCLQCSIPDKAGADTIMSLENFKLIVDKLVEHGTQGITLSGGEPALNPYINEMIEYVSSKNLLRTQLLTNLYMPDSILDPLLNTCFKYGIPLQTSFDGLGKTADLIRGAKDVEKTVTANILKINEMNRNAQKGIQTRISLVVSKMNIDQIPQILQRLKEFGWKAYTDIYRWSSESHTENESMKVELDEKFSRAIELLKESEMILTPDWLLNGYENYFRNEAPKMCPYIESPTFGSKFFIHPKGEVSVCIGNSIGNILDSTPAELTSSEVWQSFKDKFEKCSGCWNTCYTPFYFPIRYVSKEHFGQYMKILDRG